MVLIFYNLALLAVLLLGSPYWLLRMATSGKYRAGLAGRLGCVPSALRQFVSGRGVVWLHAVSLGEVISASRLVSELRAALPHHAVVISTTTRAGQQLAGQRFGADSVFYFPLDFTWVVRRYLRALKPRLLVLAETEFWPSLLLECKRASIPVAVVNARISDRSFPRYQRLRFLWSRLLSGISIFLAQSEIDAHRLIAIGAPSDRVHISGNLKFDVRTATDNALTVAIRAALPPKTNVLVVGSTLDTEEATLLKAWPQILAAEPNCILLLAPRHPERFDAVARLLDAAGHRWHRRSQWLSNASPATTPLATGDIFLLDSIGELAASYSLATVAFVGGSIAQGGGHNPLEPAQFGVPVVMGRSLENFRAIADDMLASEALLIVDEADLAPAIINLLTHPAGAAAIGARGRAVFDSQSGATARTITAIVEILQAPATAPKKSQAMAARPSLFPLTPLYAAAVAAKNNLYDAGHLYTAKLNSPVISIGSLSAGGSGKTPFTLLLANTLGAHGWQPDILSRGYGRNSTRPEKVDPNGTALQFGDEPLLLARHHLDVFVAPARLAAGSLAESTLAPSPHRIHLLDDGFQHRRLYRDLDIVLFTAQDWNDILLPAGNLREPITSLMRADAVVLREEEAWLEERLHAFFAPQKFVPQIHLIRRSLVIEHPPSRPLVFCGIARPDIFLAMLAAAGHTSPLDAAIFRDHQPYTQDVINQLLQIARAENANGFITTEKDAVKFTPEIRSQLESIGPITIATLQTTFCDQSAVTNWLLPRLKLLATSEPAQ